MPLHPIRAAPPPPPREASNNNIKPNKKQEKSSSNLNNNVQKRPTVSLPTIIRPIKKKAPPPRPAPPKKYQPKPDLLSHLNFVQKDYVTPNFDVQHIHKHSSDKDIKLNAFSKKVGTPKNQMNHCLIDLDSPNIFSNINNIPTTHPSKSLLDEDNIEEVPHVPLLEALGPKPITLLPTNVTKLQANPSVFCETKEKKIPEQSPRKISQSSSSSFSKMECSTKSATSLKRRFLTALYDFPGEMEEDLNLKAGDRIIFLHEINKDWWYGEINGKRGQFPSKFVADDSSESFITDNIEASPSPLQDQKRVVALYDFLEGEKGDLAFKTGDVIMVLYQINSDWIFGELNGKQGQFPANFVQDEAPENNASNENPEKVMNECMPPPLGIFVALYNFKAEQPGDLELHEGDRVLVTECIDNEWWQGMITPAGTTGIFPSNFVKRID